MPWTGAGLSRRVDAGGAHVDEYVARTHCGTWDVSRLEPVRTVVGYDGSDLTAGRGEMRRDRGRRRGRHRTPTELGFLAAGAAAQAEEQWENGEGLVCAASHDDSPSRR